jgi:hypothetical protein
MPNATPLEEHTARALCRAFTSRSRERDQEQLDRLVDILWPDYLPETRDVLAAVADKLSRDLAGGMRDLAQYPHLNAGVTISG